MQHVFLLNNTSHILKSVTTASRGCNDNACRIYVTFTLACHTNFATLLLISVQ